MSAPSLRYTLHQRKIPCPETFRGVSDHTPPSLRRCGESVIVLTFAWSIESSDFFARSTFMSVQFARVFVLFAVLVTAHWSSFALSAVPRADADCSAMFVDRTLLPEAALFLLA